MWVPCVPFKFGNHSKPKKSQRIVLGSGQHKHKELYEKEYPKFPEPLSPEFSKKGYTKHRHNVYSRDGYRCLKCGADKGLTLDHVKPRSKGGSNHFSNLQTLCFSCNTKKGSNEVDYRKINVALLI